MFDYFRKVWRSPARRMKLFYLASAALFVGIILLFIASTAVVAVFSVGLPSPNKVIRREGYSTVIYDRNGKVLYDLYNNENRVPLKLSEMPKYLKEGTIAVEDKDFYKHQGFDPLGGLRIAKNLVTMGTLTGASTLTQQLVKNTLLSSERTLPRKIKEIILSNQLESKFTKDEVLQMYLNEVPYGGAAYGVESASKMYFNKSAKDLNLVESAILSGLPQAPSVYSPLFGEQGAYIPRTEHVLRRMQQDGYITPQQEADAVKQLPKVKFASSATDINAPHFVFYVRDQLVKKFGEGAVEGGGLKVTTTLDLDTQEKAEKIVNEEVKKLKAAKATNGAAVVLNAKTGEILSMVGSYDYFDKDFGSYNVATALRQPGSSGKPFVFAAAIAKGYPASTMLMDVKTAYPSGEKDKPDYVPENYDLKYHGPMQLRFALGNSINTIAVKLTAIVGLSNIMQLGYDAGISTWEPTAENLKNVGLSLALGGREVKLLEMTSAYGMFANGGVRQDPISILKVTDTNGKVLYEHHDSAGKKVLSPEVSFIISHILSDNNARKDVFGESNLLVVSGKTVAAKTGTTDKKRDNWTFGYDPSGHVVGVWVGNNDNTVMSPIIASGVTGATPIWNKIMRVVLADIPRSEFKKPDGVEAFEVDSIGGGLPVSGGTNRSEYFVKGTVPTAPAPIYKKVKISKANGKLANDFEIKSGNYEEKDYIVISEKDPVSTDGKNRWQDAINEWLKQFKKDDSKWNPPTDKSDSNSDGVGVNVSDPHDAQRFDSNEVPIKAKAFGSRDIVKFTVEVDGSEKISKVSDNIDDKLNLSDGPHTVKFKATDSGGNSGEATIKIGVKANWDSNPGPSPVPSPSPTP